MRYWDMPVGTVILDENNADLVVHTDWTVTVSGTHIMLMRILDLVSGNVFSCTMFEDDEIDDADVMLP